MWVVQRHDVDEGDLWKKVGLNLLSELKDVFMIQNTRALLLWISEMKQMGKSLWLIVVEKVEKLVLHTDFKYFMTSPLNFFFFFCFFFEAQCKHDFSFSNPWTERHNVD